MRGRMYIKKFDWWVVAFTVGFLLGALAWNFALKVMS